jgi:rhomboid protease GluP
MQHPGNTEVASNTEQVAPDQLSFYSSGQSQTGKAQKWLWLSALIALLASLAMQKNIPGFPTFTIVTFVIVFGGIWLYQRSLLKPGQALVSLNHEYIESLLFRGNTKRYLWTEIAAVSFKAQSNMRFLEFKLTDKEGRPDKRNFWNGVNYARPFIQLAAFDELTQEKMLEAIKRCIEKQAPVDGQAIGELVNEIAIEREFQERLRAMAPVPWVTYSLIAMNGLIWLLTLSMGAGFVIAGADKLLVWGGNAASEVQRGEWWRLVSATFLHSGFMHVTMNMVGLAAAGVTVERIYGHRLFTLIYFGSGLSGSALSLHFGAQNAVSVGASGAVFGVTGALLVAVFQNRDKLPKTFSKQTISGLSIFILYALMQGFAKQGIDNAAHVGGLLGGCLCAFILPERFDIASFKNSFVKRAAMALVIVGTATVGLAAMAPRATIDQARIFSSNEILIQSFKQFEEGMKALQQDQSNIMAGKLSEKDADDRGRRVHAPVFRHVADGLSKIVLRPGDPREQVSKDIQRMSELLYEGLAMESVFNEETKKFDPIDPLRATKIEEELIKVTERTTKSLNSIKNKGNAERPSNN